MDRHLENQKKYYDKVFNESKDVVFSNDDNFFMKRFVNSAIGNNIQNVLEIGCGNGTLTGFLLKKPVKITAVDISEEAVKSMKKKFEKEIGEGRLELECADVIDYLEKSEKKYDVIIGSGIIHHIEKKSWDILFHLAHKRLNSGGIFACGPEPNASGLYFLAWLSARFFYKLFGMDYDWEVEKWTLDMIPKKLEYSMRKAGFIDPEIKPYQLIPHFHLKMLEYLDKKLINYIKGKISLYIIVKGENR